MAFPSTPLDVLVELQVGGTWTDITADSYTRSPIGIECGRSEESVRTNPGRLTLEINNREGKYSPRNPRSPYYGLIGRNTPIRLSVGGPSYLSTTGALGSGAHTPDTAALDVTGDIDIRVDATLDNWRTTGVGPSVDLVGKWSTTGNQRSWMLQSRDGKPHLEWSPDGSTVLQADATVMPVLPVSRRMAWRVTLDVNNGAGGWTATFYTAPTIAGPWTQLGAPVTGAGTTSIFTSTTELKVGDATNLTFAKPIGRVHAAEVRNGIGGALVAAPDFTTQTPGAGSFTDSTGKVWTVLGTSTIGNRYTRFVGEVSSWPARWDVSGRDVWVPIEAAGILRRLGQGRKSLDSTLRRRIPSHSPLAYWPCEDDEGATQAYSPIRGVAPLRLTGGWTFGQDDTLAGSSPLPAVEPGARMRGTVPAPPAGTTQWSVHMLYAVDTAPASDAEFLSWTTSGTVRRWRILQRTGVGTVQGFAADGTQIVNATVGIGSDVFTGWQRLQFEAEQNGANVDWSLFWFNIGGSAGGFSGSVAGSVGQVALVDTQFGATVSGLRIGHLSVLPVGDGTDAAAYRDADHGYSNEPATDRMERLAAEESATVALTVFNGSVPAASEPLGPQRPASLLDLLQDAADCDGGILYEDRASSSLVYRDRRTLYNQAPALVLDYTAEGEVGPPLEPVEDDQRTRNDVTVSRSGGSSSRAVRSTGPLSVQPPPQGVGVYDESVTLNLGADHQTEHIAGWRLHLGTWDEARYPTVRLMLHAAPHLIPAYLTLKIGDRIQITNPPTWLPPGPIDLFVQGIAEVIDQYTWDVTLTCTPAGPWTVGVVGDAVRGRIATDGCTLGGAVSASATSFTLVSSPGPRWVDSAAYPSRFPFDLLVGGERVRVTAVTGTTLTQTATVTRAVNGISKAHAAGADVQVADPARIAL
ncbi:hypothetical protein ACFY7C_37400 [Streptomyces sp. NPDC012769]|uniref:hypothetical protein n=1 Tax=Streptomyces sp. NPDC012769 TaxID=3364848 RepID=UPI00368845E3